MSRCLPLRPSRRKSFWLKTTVGKVRAQELQPKLGVKFPAVVRAAADQTSRSALDPPDARKIGQTMRTAINETTYPFADWEGKIVTTLFVANTEIMARRAPFRTVRQNAPPAGTKLRKKMRQFMTQCSIDLGKSMFAEQRIQ